MTNESSLPLLSEYDSIDSSEGSLDPLGLYPIADNLASLLAPGVRERQSHPRFLTAIAVSSFICSKFEEDIVAKDGVSPPWQVLEWYLVEGLVRTSEDKEIQGLPGREKAFHAIKDGVPLSANRYLKAPSVFGFHGVYRTLAHALGIERDGHLEERGYLLIKAWIRERKLTGFIEPVEGQGQEAVRLLYKAIQDGLEKGATDRSGGWSGWQFFKDNLAIYEIGKEEGRLLYEALIDPASSFRKQTMEFLVSDKGKKAWANENEREFHIALKSSANPELKQLLETILSYETFSNFLQNAFDECLFHMTKRNTRVPCKEFADLPMVKEAHKNIGRVFRETLDRLQMYRESARFEELFSQLADKVDRPAWTQLLFDHHMRIQRSKPPSGKSPWFERFDNGDVFINPTYRREAGDQDETQYVHYFRTRPLWSFANDLKLV